MDNDSMVILIALHFVPSHWVQHAKINPTYSPQRYTEIKRVVQRRLAIIKFRTLQTSESVMDNQKSYCKNSDK